MCAITAHADVYDDCVLKGMKGVSSDVGARLVAEACRNKVNEAKRAKQESFGSELNKSEYKFGNNSAERHDGGYFSETLRNTSSSKTLTYVELTIKDGDYYDYKKPRIIVIPTPPLSGISFMDRDYGHDIPEDDGRWKWESERTRTYFYKLFLRPGKEIRLMFPAPPTDRFYSEITNALGREAKWTDAASTTSLSNTIKPEPRDPLE